MKSRLNYRIFAISLAGLFSLPVHACADFKLVAKDGTVLVTRSLEFAEDLKSNVRSSPRGREFTTVTPNKKSGLSWKAKYGYVYADGFGIDASFDGMNENGLTFAYLYLPGETKYQSIPDGKDAQAIPYTLFGDWILSNFKSIDEIKAALNDVYVTDQTVPQLGDAVLYAHASIYEPSGKGIVVEFYNNKINVSDNIGVMTNSPKYEWHLTNLRNYLNLSPYNSDAITAGGETYTSTGQGSGAFGLPGDASPPSRFVKIAFMAKNVFQAENAVELLNLGQHIINNFDLPAGYVRSKYNGKTVSDITQWTVFRDLTHKIYYYHSYNDMTLHAIDLNKLNLSENAPALKMPLAGEPVIIDVTDQFAKTTK